MADHNESAERQWAMLGRPRKPRSEDVVAGPPFPEALEYLWRWFNEILSGCPSNGWGPPAIGWRDLAAWTDQTGNRLEPWESMAMIRLSGVFGRVNAPKKTTKPAGGGKR